MNESQPASPAQGKSLLGELTAIYTRAITLDITIPSKVNIPMFSYADRFTYFKDIVEESVNDPRMSADFEKIKDAYQAKAATASLQAENERLKEELRRHVPMPGRRHEYERIPEVVEAFQLTSKAMKDDNDWPKWVVELVCSDTYISDWIRHEIWIVRHNGLLAPYTDEAFHRYFRTISNEGAK